VAEAELPAALLKLIVKLDPDTLETYNTLPISDPVRSGNVRLAVVVGYIIVLIFPDISAAVRLGDEESLEIITLVKEFSGTKAFQAVPFQ
jgi:hypothetical protein